LVLFQDRSWRFSNLRLWTSGQKIAPLTTLAASVLNQPEIAMIAAYLLEKVAVAVANLLRFRSVYWIGIILQGAFERS